MCKYSVVVPVYNSEKTLDELYIRVKNVFEKKINDEFEMILVDDSSKDDSFKVMVKLHEKDERVKVIQLSKNYGQHNAILCGLRYAEGEYVITLDDDLQHPPEEIEKLVRYICKHDEVDVVIGKYDSKKHNWYRNLGSNLVKRVTKVISNNKSNLELTSFRIMRRDVVRAMLEIHVTAPRIGYLILEVTNRIKNIEVSHKERKVGKSQYTLSKLVRDFFNNIFYNTIFPLKLLRNTGLISFVCSILLACFYLYRYFTTGISVEGWMTIVLFQLLFSGIILCGLGVIGEYLLRILHESKKLNNYNIRKKVF